MKYVIRKWTLVLAVFLAFFGSASCMAAYAFSGGSGTPDDPYIITSAAELNAVRYNLTAHFRLSNDIDLTNYLAPGGAGYAKWGAAGWLPIGTTTRSWPQRMSCELRFAGEFDGNGHKITGLWIARRGEDSVGLFGAIENATIKNLGVEIAATKSVRGCSIVGGLVGGQFGGSIAYSHTIGNVIGDRNVGGLLGLQSSGSIIYSYATGNIGGLNSIGGLVGWQQLSGSIENSYATGNVVGSRRIGGLVGMQFGSSITNSYATGNVRGIYRIGGLLGHQYSGSIANSYATGNVHGGIRGARYIGGLVGSQDLRGRSAHYFPLDVIKNSFTTGNIIGYHNVGSLVGRRNSYSKLTNSYYYINLYINLTINSEKNIENTPDGIHGSTLTVAQFMTQATYVDNGWLFYPDGPWHWDERGFPKLNIGAENFPFDFNLN